MLRKCLVLTLISFLVTVSSGPVMGQDNNGKRLFNTNIGDVLIYPSVSQSLQYDNNILLEGDASDPESDFISRSTLGVYLKSPTVVDVQINHRTTLKEFLDNKNFNDVENRTTGKLEYSTQSVAFGVSGMRFETSEPLDLVFANRQRLDRSSFLPFFTFYAGNTSTTFQYRSTNFEYEDPNFSSFNYRKQSGEVETTYDFSRNGFLRGRLKTGEIDYEDETIGDSLGIDNPFLEATFGGGGFIANDLQLVVDGGVHVRSDLEELLESSDTTDVDAVDALSYVPVGNVTLIWSKSDSDRITLGFMRTVGQSAFSNHLTRNRLKAEYNKRFNPLWSGSTSLSYTSADESSEGVPQAEKKSYRFQVDSTYEFRPWLPVSLLYTFYEKNTNDGVGEFDVQRLGVSATARF